MTIPPLVLASASPRRKDLLDQAGVSFVIIPADVPEPTIPGEAPAQMAMRLATDKAVAVAQRLGPQPARWVLGADTIVIRDDEILGKPRDAEHAVALLSSLVGRRHEVITGYCLVQTAELSVQENVNERGQLGEAAACVPHAAFVSSEVTMRSADEDEIRAYVATGEPLDKAGAYAVQGQGRSFVVEVSGSRDNVIGLPVAEVLADLERCIAMRDEMRNKETPAKERA